MSTTITPTQPMEQKIKAGDLRKGILVYGVSDRIETVVGWYGEDVYTVMYGEQKPYKNNINDLSPIKLSEDILIRAGFEKVGRNFELDGFLLWWNNSLEKLVYRKGFKEYVEVDYLHTLQNLYYALENTELQIKQL